MRFAVHTATLAALVALPAASPQPDPLLVVAAASGHAATVHFRATGQRVIEGRTVTTVLDQFGARRLLQRCVAGVCGGIWFDGSREWTFGLNEVALPEESDEATLVERTLYAIASYAFAEPSFRAAGGTVVAAGAGRWRVRAPDGLELIAVTDPATHSLRRVETTNARPLATYAREARAGGAAFALDRSGSLESGPLDAVTTAPGTPSPPPGPLATFEGETPLPLGDDVVPIVDCRVGGRTERCLIDSGATPSAVTLEVAEALHLEPHGELEIFGLGRFATGFVEAGPLTLGPAHFGRVRFAVIPPQHGARFDVVIGSDLLDRVRLVLDRAHNLARIEPPGDAAAAGTAVHVTFRAGSPIVQAMLGPLGTRALLDTGDQAVVSFGYSTYRQGPQWPIIGRGQAVGVAGSDDILTVQLPELQIGSLAVGPSPATVRRTQGQAHVGIGLWQRYRIDLDEAAGRISFSPPK